MKVDSYIWKASKTIVDNNTIVQREQKMIEMSEEELRNAYQHCKDMLYNSNNEHPGRYLVLDEIAKQIKYCNVELAIRWFLSKTSSDGKPIYTRFSIISEINDFIVNNNGSNIKLSDIRLKDIYSGLPIDYNNISVDLFLKGCKELLGKFNKSHITQNFIINLGIWFSPDEIKTFELVEKLTSMEDRINTVKERLNLRAEVKIPMKSTGLNYTQFRAMIGLKSNKKYTELTSVQLETLRDKVLYVLEENVRYHISQWETLMTQLEEVCKHKGIKL